MHIIQLTLQTSELHEQRAFYEQMLGLHAVNVTSNSFRLQIGETQLTFQATEQPDITYHFAIMLPHKRLALAKERLHAHHIPLLTRAGKEEFEFDFWNANSLYFHDSANNIVEFIVHHDLLDERSGPFDMHDFLRVCEIGLVVDDVPALVRYLKDNFAIEPYKGSSSATFTAAGDINGLFIAVPRERPWWPTDDERSVFAPLHVSIQGEQAQSSQIAAFPYIIDVRVVLHSFVQVIFTLIHRTVHICKKRAASFMQVQ